MVPSTAFLAIGLGILIFLGLAIVLISYFNGRSTESGQPPENKRVSYPPQDRERDDDPFWIDPPERDW